MPAKILILGEFAKLWQRSLEPYGYQASTTVSEHEAITQLMTERFDLLFLDFILSDFKSGDDFLAKLRSRVRSIDTLVLMKEGKDGRNGIIRAPTFPNQANGYIISPFLPEDLVKMVEKLLAGASTQQTPGDEGYAQCEYQDWGWNIVFEYPALWEVRSWRKDLVQVLGPLHRSLKASAKIAIYRHLTHDSESPYIVQEVMSNRYGDFYKVRQTTQEQQVQIAGLKGQEAEYLWETADYRDCSGRVIMAVVSQNKAVYALSLEAAEDDFDDYRPVYLHLLESFQFLS